MASFQITGGRKLKGELIPQGAKNEALQILCAVLLTKEPVTIHNIPSIRDVNQLIDLLGDMGVWVTRVGEGSYRFQASDVNLDYLESDTYKRKAAALRGSVM
ncbi:MAG: UDP-N-acetylglucosamine 1-carboxyvinyltransferase, partial [Cytophagaceae bacterium]